MIGPKVTYLNNYGMDCHETLHRHSCSPEDESCWLWWSSDFLSSATMRLTFAGFLVTFSQTIEWIAVKFVPSRWTVITLVFPSLFHLPVAASSGQNCSSSSSYDQNYLPPQSCQHDCRVDSSSFFQLVNQWKKIHWCWQTIVWSETPEQLLNGACGEIHFNFANRSITLVFARDKMPILFFLLVSLQTDKASSLKTFFSIELINQSAR